MHDIIKEFQDVRTWASIRGVNNVEPQTQYQRFLQEGVEIHKAMIDDDKDEIVDAIGDTIITLINLANAYNLKAEDCLRSAFNVIKLRKGITTPEGDFIRYKKLNSSSKDFCDINQGNKNNQYFDESKLHLLTPKNFKE